MTMNYITLARENRKKALSGLKSRRLALSLPGCAVYDRSTSREIFPAFVSTRSPSPLTPAYLH